MSKVDETILMRHDKEAIFQVMKDLYTFSSDSNYQSNLKKMVEYIEDLTNLMLRYKQVAEQSSKTLSEIVTQVKTAMEEKS